MHITLIRFSNKNKFSTRISSKTRMFAIHCSVCFECKIITVSKMKTHFLMIFEKFVVVFFVCVCCVCDEKEKKLSFKIRFRKLVVSGWFADSLSTNDHTCSMCLFVCVQSNLCCDCHHHNHKQWFHQRRLLVMRLWLHTSLMRYFLEKNWNSKKKFRCEVRKRKEK